MRYVLILFAGAFMVAFGAISMVQSYTPANAGIGAADDVQDDDGFNECHDDGDDGENPGVADYPDEEDNDKSDSEDDDSAYESDDPQQCRGILPDTATPCPSILQPAGGSSECCPLTLGVVYHCVCPDSVGGGVGAEAYLCYCVEGGQPNGCLCQDTFSAPDCCISYGYFCGTAASSADADCDGEVTAADAYDTLIVLSGFESGAGGGCGGGSPGDADCSNVVDAKDTLVILAVVAGLEEAPAC